MARTEAERWEVGGNEGARVNAKADGARANAMDVKAQAKDVKAKANTIGSEANIIKASISTEMATCIRSYEFSPRRGRYDSLLH